jgi:aminoglycoside phosphotransferase (APT) family kinase protein
LIALVEKLEPGGHLLGARRLAGGLSARMHVLNIERADGTRSKITLRLTIPEYSKSPSDDTTREFETLRVLEAAGVPAPRPLVLDAEGEFFGTPAIILTYLAGKPWFPKANLGPWTEGLARGAAAVHSVTPARHDLSFLEVVDQEHMLRHINHRREERPPDPFIDRMQQVLRANLDRIELLPFTLIHADYWSGNTIWSRNKLQGVIDWSDSKIGDPRADISEMRLDLAIGYGIEVADQFATDCERLGENVCDLWYFDLYRGMRAIQEYDWWLEGYHDMRQTHLTAEIAGERLRAFLGRALEEA